MKCPKCKLVEMLVKRVDKENNEVEHICKRCGTTKIEELPQEN